MWVSLYSDEAEAVNYFVLSLILAAFDVSLKHTEKGLPEATDEIIYNCNTMTNSQLV